MLNQASAIKNLVETKLPKLGQVKFTVAVNNDQDIEISNLRESRDFLKFLSSHEKIMGLKLKRKGGEIISVTFSDMALFDQILRTYELKKELEQQLKNLVARMESLEIKIDLHNGKIMVTRMIPKGREEGIHYTFNESFAKFLEEEMDNKEGVTVITAVGKGKGATAFECDNKEIFDQLMSEYRGDALVQQLEKAGLNNLTVNRSEHGKIVVSSFLKQEDAPFSRGEGGEIVMSPVLKKQLENYRDGKNNEKDFNRENFLDGSNNEKAFPLEFDKFLKNHRNKKVELTKSMDGEIIGFKCYDKKTFDNLMTEYSNDRAQAQASALAGKQEKTPEVAKAEQLKKEMAEKIRKSNEEWKKHLSRRKQADPQHAKLEAAKQPQVKAEQSLMELEAQVQSQKPSIFSRIANAILSLGSFVFSVIFAPLALVNFFMKSQQETAGQNAANGGGVSAQNSSTNPKRKHPIVTTSPDDSNIVEQKGVGFFNTQRKANDSTKDELTQGQRPKN